MGASSRIYLSVLGAALCAGCPDPEGDLDRDGDGTPDAQDCAPSDPNVHPDQIEQCDGVDVNCDGVADDGFDDTDGDGVASCGGDPVGGFQEDCDDNNPDVRPGLSEACDGVDNNCNDVIDEATDVDGDSFTSCGAQPDCDDGDPDVNPSAAEVCDDRDNNCDGEIDEGFDADDDGLASCRGDCDDNNPNVRPSAAEICDNADNDCNGEVDEGFDTDDDGFTSCGGDCDDLLSNRNPGAPEICDLVDNNCNTQIDEGFDADNDGSTSCGGDCNDDDDTIDLGNPELEDDKDNDCDGLIDEIFDDNDGDGFSPAEGDCDDTVFEVGPNAIEFQGNVVDDDCNGAIDSADPACAGVAAGSACVQPCDGGNLNTNNPSDFARAIGLCNGEVLTAQYVGFANQGAAARAVATQFGTHTAALNRPAEGARMGILSSGRADSTNHDSGFAFDGTLGGNVCAIAHPFPSGDPGVCGAADPANVCDLAEVRLTIQVPTNARSFSYQFQFWSSEYPTFRCTFFDDTFLALLDSDAFTGNISVDNTGYAVSINTPFLDICLDDVAGQPRDVNGDGIIPSGEVVPTTNECSVEDGAALTGTGYAFDNDATNNGAPDLAGSQSLGAGATTVLTTFSPIEPGEIITLRFIIFDEGDDQIDSTTIIDNFRWRRDAIDEPVTQQ
jgi:hypothetical protein